MLTQLGRDVPTHQQFDPEEAARYFLPASSEHDRKAEAQLFLS